jgi:hypothetical protein
MQYPMTGEGIPKVGGGLLRVVPVEIVLALMRRRPANGRSSYAVCYALPCLSLNIGVSLVTAG